MEVIIKKFINYLFEFGLVSLKSIKTILSVYENNKSYINNTKTITINDKLKLLLIEYFDSLLNQARNTNTSSISNDGKIDIVCEDIVDKYYENIKLEKFKRLKNIYLIYKFSKNSTRINTKVKYFTRFKMHTLMIKRSFSNKYISRNSNFSHEEPSKTSLLSKKEEDDVINCTFHPKINKKHSQIMGNKDWSDRLHNEYKRRQEKQITKKEKLEKNSFNKFNFDIRDYMYKSDIDITSDFYQRQNMFYLMKNEKKDHLIKNLDQIVMQDCSFKPRLNESFNSGKVEENKDIYQTPRYEKLYSQGYKKQRNRSFEKYNSKCSNNLNLNVNINLNRPNSTKHTNSKSVDMNKINNLYQDFKRKSIKNKERLDLIQREQGWTYRPSLNKNRNKIESTFEERNLLYIRKKEYISNINKIDQFNNNKQTIEKINQNKSYNSDYKKSNKQNLNHQSNKLINKLYTTINNNKSNKTHHKLNFNNGNLNSNGSFNSNLGININNINETPQLNRQVFLQDNDKVTLYTAREPNSVFTLNQSERSNKTGSLQQSLSNTIKACNETISRNTSKKNLFPEFDDKESPIKESHNFIPPAQDNNSSKYKRFKSTSLQNLLENKYV